MTSETTVHIPVLPTEILELSNAQPGQSWIDGTAGGGGHSRLLAERLATTGKLLAIDRDPGAAELLEQKFKLPPHGSTVVRQGSYDCIPEFLHELQWSSVDGILLDLGLSSDQLADRDRGFSFQTDGELDMRFDPSSGEPAWEWLARVDEKTLADTIYQFGEERFSRRIAKRIVESRREQPLRLASELRELVYRCVPSPRKLNRFSQARGKHKSIDPATRTFQALRIAVNDELSILERALARLPDSLAEGGLLMIISFHSLEDRLVKYAFRGDERLEIVTKKPVQAGDREVAANPRSRSAKLRIARRRPQLPSENASNS